MEGSKLTLTLDETCKRLGIKHTTFYRLRRRDPSFPKPIKALSQSKLLFSASDIAHWVETAERG